MPALLEGWESDYDGNRWFYRYKPTGQTQFHFPQEGDEFPDFFHLDTPVPDLSLEEKLESQQQVKGMGTTGKDGSDLSSPGKARMKATAGPMSVHDSLFSSGQGSRCANEDDDDDDDDGGFYYQPESFMFLGPGAYNDISPPGDDDDGDVLETQEGVKGKEQGGGDEVRDGESVARSSKVSPLQSETTTAPGVNSEPATVDNGKASPGATLFDSRAALHDIPSNHKYHPVGVLAEMPDPSVLAHVELHPDPIEMGDHRILAPIETQIPAAPGGIAELAERTSPSERKQYDHDAHDALHKTTMSDRVFYQATFGSRPIQQTMPPRSGTQVTTKSNGALEASGPRQAVQQQSSSSITSRPESPLRINRKPTNSRTKSVKFQLHDSGTAEPAPAASLREHRKSLTRDASLMISTRTPANPNAQNMSSVLQPPKLPPKQPLGGSSAQAFPYAPEERITALDDNSHSQYETGQVGASRDSLDHVPSILKPARGRRTTEGQDQRPNTPNPLIKPRPHLQQGQVSQPGESLIIPRSRFIASPAHRDKQLPQLPRQHSDGVSLSSLDTSSDSPSSEITMQTPSPAEALRYAYDSTPGFSSAASQDAPSQVSTPQRSRSRSASSPGPSTSIRSAAMPQKAPIKTASQGAHTNHNAPPTLEQQPPARRAQRPTIITQSLPSSRPAMSAPVSPGHSLLPIQEKPEVEKYQSRSASLFSQLANQQRLLGIARPTQLRAETGPPELQSSNITDQMGLGSHAAETKSSTAPASFPYRLQSHNRSASSPQEMQSPLKEKEKGGWLSKLKKGAIKSAVSHKQTPPQSVQQHPGPLQVHPPLGQSQYASHIPASGQPPQIWGEGDMNPGGLPVPLRSHPGDSQPPQPGTSGPPTVLPRSSVDNPRVMPLCGHPHGDTGPDQTLQSTSSAVQGLNRSSSLYSVSQLNRQASNASAYAASIPTVDMPVAQPQAEYNGATPRHSDVLPPATTTLDADLAVAPLFSSSKQRSPVPSPSFASNRDSAANAMSAQDAWASVYSAVSARDSRTSVDSAVSVQRKPARRASASKWERHPAADYSGGDWGEEEDWGYYRT